MRDTFKFALMMFWFGPWFVPVAISNDETKRDAPQKEIPTTGESQLDDQESVNKSAIQATNKSIFQTSIAQTSFEESFIPGKSDTIGFLKLFPVKGKEGKIKFTSNGISASVRVMDRELDRYGEKYIESLTKTQVDRSVRINRLWGNSRILRITNDFRARGNLADGEVRSASSSTAIVKGDPSFETAVSWIQLAKKLKCRELAVRFSSPLAFEEQKLATIQGLADLCAIANKRDSKPSSSSTVAQGDLANDSETLTILIATSNDRYANVEWLKSVIEGVRSKNSDFKIGLILTPAEVAQIGAYDDEGKYSLKNNTGAITAFVPVCFVDTAPESMQKVKLLKESGVNFPNEFEIHFSGVGDTATAIEDTERALNKLFAAEVNSDKVSSDPSDDSRN